jgi:hypothetical protein
MNPLHHAIIAVSALNAFARTNTVRQSDGLKSQIYALKREAIIRARAEFATIERDITVSVKCRKCGGSGKWTSYHTYSRDVRNYGSCWGCGGSGKVTLHFRETHIGATLANMAWPPLMIDGKLVGDVCWHTPISQSEACETPSAETNWHPLLPGKELTVDEVCAALNVAEEELCTLPREYRLNIGCGVEFCGICGGNEVKEWHWINRGLLSWSGAACQSCMDHYRSLSKDYGPNLIFKKLPLPETILTPNVMAWCDRRGGVKKVLAAAYQEDRDWE